MGGGRDAVAATCAGNPHPPVRRHDREAGSARAECGAGGDAKGRRNRPPGARRRRTACGAFLAALRRIGVQTPSLLAAPGAAGLAIGLALQGRLAKYRRERHGLWLRRFRVDGLSKFSAETRLWARSSRSGFSPACSKPRTAFSMFAVHVAQPFPAANPSQGDGRTAGVLVDPPPDVFIANLNAGAPQAACRFWGAHDEVATVQRAIIETARQALADAGLHPTQLIRTIPADTDPSRLA